MTLKQTKQRGFTVVELLIVVVIIAILAAITIVAYNGIQNRAKTSAAAGAASTLQKKIEAYAVENTNYPATLSQMTGATIDKTFNLPTDAVTLTTAALSQSTDPAKTIRFRPCGVTGTAPNQTAVGYQIDYWNYDGAGSQKTIVGGTSNGACNAVAS